MGRVIAESSSGRELIARGFSMDVEIAAEHNVSGALPVLRTACLPI